MKLVSAVLMTLMMVSVANATPGDMGCEGKTADGKVIDVLIGYDYFGQGPSLFEVTVGKDKVFSSNAVKEEMFNVGSEKNPFILSGISAISIANQGVALLKWPEQAPTQDGTLDGILTLSVAGQTLLNNAEIKCYR